MNGPVKLLIGCGVLLLFGVLTLGGVFYFKVLKPATAMVAASHEAYAQSNQAFAFTPPADSQIPRERFADFLAVRSATAAQAKGIVEAVNQADNTSQADFKQVRTIVSSAFTSIFHEIPKAHLENLYQYEMSMAEYQWFTTMMLLTLHQAADQKQANNADYADADRILDAMIDGLEKEENIQADPEGQQDLKRHLANQKLKFLDENLSTLLHYKDALTSPSYVYGLDMSALAIPVAREEPQ